MSTDRLIVTACDAKYVPLVQELFESVRAFRDAPAQPLAVLDAGMTADQTAMLADRYGARILQGDWPYGMDPVRMKAAPHLKANLLRCHLDRLAPDAGAICWIDADAWVQDFAAVEMMFEAAEHTRRLAIVCQSSRHSSVTMTLQWIGLGAARVRSILYKNARNAGYPESVARRMADQPTLNSGVFTLRGDAPHWQAWRARHREVILERRGRLFTSDQLSLGLMHYIDGLPVERMPDTCNYMGPFWKASDDGRRLVEYFWPHAPVGIVHMAGEDLLRADAGATRDIPTISGASIRRSLRQPGWG
jgi:hypothetical protein